MLAFTGIASMTPETEIHTALLAKLITDQSVLDMIQNNHSNITGDHTPDFCLKIIFSIAKSSACTVHYRVNRTTIPVPATRVLLPPFGLDPDVNEGFRCHVMSVDSSSNVPLRGTGKPWVNLGSAQTLSSVVT
jgi:hypothetical protein